jgi:hypothetical protein
MIQGTGDMPVTMTSVSTSPQSGDWNGITFDTVADLNTSIIKGLRLSFAVDGINGKAGIPEIKESRFFSCRQSGIQSADARADIVVRNVEVDTCASGILINDNPVAVQIFDSELQRCIYGIVCRDNLSAEIKRNVISFAGVSGIDIGNESTASIVSNNVVGFGSNGTGILCRGKDEVRRNTIQTNIGIEIKETAAATVRSNLILADSSRSAIGVLYSGTETYSTASNTFQYNMIWDIPTGNARRYSNSDATSLPGITADLRFDPSLTGGDPFAGLPTINYSYVPSPGSSLKAAGYDSEDVGAFDVPD